MALDPTTPLIDSATGPASASLDGQSQSEHSLADQIAAAKFLAATRARSTSPAAGATFAKLIPHGSLLGGCDR